MAFVRARSFCDVLAISLFDVFVFLKTRYGSECDTMCIPHGYTLNGSCDVDELM